MNQSPPCKCTHVKKTCPQSTQCAVLVYRDSASKTTTAFSLKKTWTFCTQSHVHIRYCVAVHIKFSLLIFWGGGQGRREGRAELPKGTLFSQGKIGQKAHTSYTPLIVLRQYIAAKVSFCLKKTYYIIVSNGAFQSSRRTRLRASCYVTVANGSRCHLVSFAPHQYGTMNINWVVCSIYTWPKELPASQNIALVCVCVYFIF